VVAALVLAGCGRIAFDERTDAAQSTACVKEVQGTGSSVCVVRTDGALLCLGFNLYGEVGDGSMTERTSLVPVLDTVSSSGAGEFNSCAARTDGSAACWGFNDLGQAGDGSTTQHAVPTVVPNLDGVEQIVAGQYYTCARRGGEVSCWGLNVDGELGDNTQTTRGTAMPVVGLTTARTITHNDHAACAVLDDSSLVCWGAGSYVGDNTTMRRLVPTPISLPGPVVGVASGCHVHTCAWLGDGTAYCWGEGLSGQLGNLAKTAEIAPQRVQLAEDIVDMATGAYHSCARTRGGDVFCWGQNVAGQVDPSAGPGDILTPVLVASGVDQVATGCRHTCVRRSDEITCWGFYGVAATPTAMPATQYPVPGC